MSASSLGLNICLSIYSQLLIIFPNNRQARSNSFLHGRYNKVFCIRTGIVRDKGKVQIIGKCIYMNLLFDLAQLLQIHFLYPKLNTSSFKHCQYLAIAHWTDRKDHNHIEQQLLKKHLAPMCHQLRRQGMPCILVTL